MKKKSGVSFIVIVTIIALLTLLAVFGLEVFDQKIPGAEGIRTGIDISGGVSAMLYPDEENPSEEDMLTAKTIMERRLDDRNIFDRNITIDNINKRILIEFPWAKSETNYNAQDAINELGQTALLTFQEVDESQVDEFGRYLPTGKILVHGEEVKDARQDNDPQNGIVVSITFKEKGAADFAKATEENLGKPIAIFMDNKLISDPRVQSVIPNGQAVITNQRSVDEARELAALIKSGALPFKLEARQIDSISPMLGQSAYDIAKLALLIAFIVVCIFMILYYRLPGLISAIALLGLVVTEILVLSWSGTSVTLPGIGGIILSIGMGVDANVIIFERIKEELKSGKTLRSSIDSGFKRAFTAVLDANVTTLITAVVLYSLGSGPIKGFAFTLGLGVLLSFITAVTASRIMLKSVSAIDIVKYPWLYGAKGGNS